jgi:glycerophosphoryl diester phosphodiesterase
MRNKVAKFSLGFVALLVVIYTVLALLAESVPDHPFFDHHDGVLVMAHRGGRGLWPENTFYAFERAVELGVDVLEMDVRSTKDGALVVMHDHTVDRTTDGTGPIQDFTLAELEELDAGYNWSDDDGQTFPFRGQGIAVPTVAEVLAAFPDVPMNIEIKQSQPPIAASLCQMIRDYGMTEWVLVASFDTNTIKEFRTACPEVATTAGEDEVRILFGLNLAFLGAIYSPPAEAVQVPEYSGDLHVVTRRFVHTAHARNMEVHVWTVNDSDDMQRFLDLGVDGMITDHPDRLLALLGR